VEVTDSSLGKASVASPPVPSRPGVYARFTAFLERQLSKPNADRKVVWIALLLLVPSIDTGLAADDYIHALMARGSLGGPEAGAELSAFQRAPLDLFRFTTGEHTLALKQQGLLPWWDDPEAKLAFLRPISSLSHYLDHLLWDGSPLLMHVHSLAWSALALFAVLALYRALAGPGLFTALAIALYALDDARGWFGSWIAARNAVIATALSTLALLVYVRARQKAASGAASLGGELLSAVVLAVALLAGEGSVAVLGYMLAYAVTLDGGSLRSRLLSFAPHAVVVLAWRAAYVALGYGAKRSGLYFDPIGDFNGFIQAFGERAPILLFSQLGGTWSDAWSALFAFPILHRLLVATSVLVIGLLGFVLYPLRKDKMVRFGVIGSLLSLVPASSAFSADRLLTWVAIGASLVLAKLIATYWQSPSALLVSPSRMLLVPPLMLWLVLDHAVGEPLFLPSRARGNVAMRNILDRAQSGVPSDPSIAEKHVIFVNPAAVPLAAYVPIERAAQGLPRAAFQVLLATADTELRVTRTGPSTLTVQPRGGYLLSPPSQLLSGRKNTFAPGHSIDLGPVTLVVKTVTSDLRPAIVEAQFERPLEDPIFVWRQWLDTGFAPFTPPAIGQSVVLPAADFLRVTLGDAVKLPFDGRMAPPVDPSF
jgi:hypothetical protein